MKAGPKKVIPALTGFRAVTIVWVALAHLCGETVQLFPSLKGLVSVSLNAGYRMDLLFILSGFVISYAYMTPQRGFSLSLYGHLLRARLIRIYPSYLVSGAVLVLAVILGTHWGLLMNYDHPVESLLVHVPMMQAWPYLDWDMNGWGGPTWFVSAIWFVYLFIFPCACLLVRKLRTSWIALCWVFTPLVLWLAASWIPSLHEFHRVLRASCGFISGSALLALYFHGNGVILTAQKHLDKMAVLFIAATCLIPVMPSDAAKLALNGLLVLMAPVLMAGLTDNASVTTRLLSARPVVWLGTISYALFLTHHTAQRFLSVALPAAHFTNSPFVIRCLVAATYLIVVLVSAIALHQLVEVPCAKAMKNFSFNRWANAFDRRARVVCPAAVKTITKPAP
jgi:peptidoglycan/LPS O-acetylase OafA/YrhL